MSMTIGNDVSSLNANRFLNQASKKKSSMLEKLSSGLRINKGADDPSGLIMSELLRSQITGYQRALRNTQETNAMMSVAEGGLSSVSSMLTKMKSLAIHAMNSGVTSDAQVNADQMELNSALTTIQRVVSTTNYAGKNLLDGTNDFAYATQDPGSMLTTSGVSISSVSGIISAQQTISYSGAASAQAERAYAEADFGNAAISTAQEFIVTGVDGSRTFAFAEGTGIEDMANQINASASSTGVNAYAVRDEGGGATTLRLVSSNYGSDASVRVQQLTGSGFTNEGGMVVDYGQDASISVNGTTVQANGLTANVSTNDFTGRLNLDANAVGQTGYDRDELINATTAQTAAVSVTNGGMQLQLSGGSGGQDRETISLGNYSTAALGSVVVDGQSYSINDLYGGGAASLANNPELAIRIIDQAIADVASGRANIGAYQANALETNANNLMVAIENTTATESSIRDADMAETMTMYIKNRLLEQASLREVQNSRMNANNVARLLGFNG